MDMDPNGKNDPQFGQKQRKNLINFIFIALCSLLRAEGFSCSVDISKLQFRSKKRYIKKNISVVFVQFLVIKTLSGLDPDPYSLEMLDPAQGT